MALLNTSALQQRDVADRFAALIGELSVAELAVLESIGIDTEFSPDPATIVRWKSGERLPKRPNHLFLIWCFQRLGALPTVEQANQWLTLAGSEALSAAEAAILFDGRATPILESGPPAAVERAPSAPPAGWQQVLPELILLARSILFPLGNLQHARLSLCRRVRAVWVEDVLAHSFYNAAVVLDLPLQEIPDLVHAAWTGVLPQKSARPTVQLQGSQIVTLFAAAQQRLLIVGEAGGGKTTLLLQLADALTNLAIADPTQPLPVVLNLISWNIRKQPFADWLVEEICRRYFIPKRVAHYWVANDELLLLLDGFDEVAVGAREQCIRMLNAFLARHPLPIAICSRHADYVAQPGRLTLETTLLVRRLARPQIAAYLAQLTLPSPISAMLLQDDPILADLTATPMLLHLMINTLATITDKEQFSADLTKDAYPTLLDTYVRQMLAARRTLRQSARELAANSPFPVRLTQWRPSTPTVAEAEICYFLSWIADYLQRNSLNLFVVEQLQPAALLNRTQRIQYVYLSRLLTGCVGGVLGGLFIGAAYAVFNAAGAEGLLRGFVEGLIGGIAGGVVMAAIDRWRLTRGHWRSVTARVHSFIGMAIETGLITVAVGLSVWIGITALLGPLAWLGYSLPFWVKEGGIVGLLTGLSFGLFFGYKQWTTGHYRFQDDIATVEQIAWSTPDALRGLVYGSLFGLLGGLFLWLNDFESSITKIFPGVQVVGLLIWIGFVLGALFGGLTGQVITTTNRSSQPIGQSFRSASQLAVGMAVICALIGFVVGLCLSASWRATMTLATYGLFAAPLAFLWYGGIDIIKHLVLRSLLWRYYQIPWRLAAVLEIAVHAALLRRAGNGYQFIHPLLLNHFQARFK